MECVLKRLCLVVEASPSGAWNGIRLDLWHGEPWKGAKPEGGVRLGATQGELTLQAVWDFSPQAG